MTRITPLCFVVALGISSPFVASARPDSELISSERLHYTLRGSDTPRGSYADWITIQRHGKRVQVIRQTIYPDHTHIQIGWGQARGNEVRVRLVDLQGVVGHLEESERKPETRLRLRVHPDGRIETQGKSTAGDSQGAGKLTGVPDSRDLQPVERLQPEGEPEIGGDDEPDADPERGLRDKIKQKGKHLVAVAKNKVKEKIRKERDELVYDGVKINEEFKIGSYFHVGVGAGIKALRPDSLTADQKATSGRRPRHIWIASRIHGGPRVALSTSIPVGSFSIGVGFNTGAKVSYEVTDIYPLPEGVTDVDTAIDDLKTVAKRTFDLPLDAKEAERMNVGAQRVFDGNGTVGVSGNLSIGHDVADFDDVVRIGASARVGGFYRITGDLRITVTRLSGNRVRVRVRRGKTKERGVSADLFLGASVGEDELKEELEPVTEYIDDALIDTTSLPDNLRDKVVEAAEDEMVDQIRDKVQNVLRFRLYGSATRAVRDEIDIAHTYDLSSERAREAYERAVRGDFTRAAKLSADPTSGVRQEFRVLDAEQRTHRGAHLRMSVFLKADFTKDIRFNNLHVEDESGRTNYEIFRFNRHKELEVGDRERSKDLKLEVIRRTREGDVPDMSRSLHAVLDHKDPTTRKSEAERWKRLMKAWGLKAGEGLETPEFRLLRSRYGRTRQRIDVGISERGLKTILAASREQVFQAYVRGFMTVEGDVPLWATAEGRQRIDDSKHDQNDSYQVERDELARAEAFVDSVRGLAEAPSSEIRAKHLKALANDASFGLFDIFAARRDLYTLAALLELAPRDTVTIDASIVGERIRIEDGRRGETFRVDVDDPRR